MSSTLWLYCSVCITRDFKRANSRHWQQSVYSSLPTLVFCLTQQNAEEAVHQMRKREDYDVKYYYYESMNTNLFEILTFCIDITLILTTSSNCFMARLKIRYQMWNIKCFKYSLKNGCIHYRIVFVSKESKWKVTCWDCTSFIWIRRWSITIGEILRSNVLPKYCWIKIELGSYLRFLWSGLWSNYSLWTHAWISCNI